MRPLTAADWGGPKLRWEEEQHAHGQEEENDHEEEELLRQAQHQHQQQCVHEEQEPIMERCAICNQERYMDALVHGVCFNCAQFDY